MKGSPFFYNILVNKVPGIQERYHAFRDGKHGAGRILSWGYLVCMNINYYIFHADYLKERLTEFHDQNICLLSVPESSISLRESPQALAEKLSGADIISFDVFDTLILRKFGNPEAVFYLLQEKLKYPNIKALRKMAEQKARYLRMNKYGDTEVTLEEIWKQLQKLTGIDYHLGIKYEEEAEMESCMGNPYFLELCFLLKKQKKKLLICSDMYLGQNRIKMLLEKCGYSDFDEYFVSCDYRKSKSTGELFQKIRKKYGTNTKYYHIGDNIYSDIKQAEKNSFHTVHYTNVNETGACYRVKDMSPFMHSVYSGIVNNQIHNGLRAYSILYELGFIYGGLFVTGYCQFIHGYVSTHSVDRILFLSRDGDIIKKVYEKLYPEDSGKTAYVYWSRLASTKMCARYFRQHYFTRMIRHKVNQGYFLKSIFHTMELDDMMTEFMENTGYSEKSILDREMAEKLERFCEKRWDEVCRHYETEILEGKDYYASVLNDARKAVAVDVGWVGSGPILLKYMIEKVWNMDCTIYGIVAGTCGVSNPDYGETEMDFCDGTMLSYLFSAYNNRDLWKIHEAAKGHNLIVELILSSDELSFQGFRKDNDGNYCFKSRAENVKSAEIQKGILDFAEYYNKHPFKEIMISGRDAAAPITLLYDNADFVNQFLSTAHINPNIE